MTQQLFDRTKKLAEQKGFSNLSDLSKEAGLGANAVYGWKNSSPRTDSVKKIADVLGTSVAYLTGEIDNPYVKSADEPDQLTDAVTEVVQNAIQNAQAYNGKEPSEADKEFMTEMLTVWLKSGGK